MRVKVLLVAVLLGIWALWGSVAVAFDHCATMAAPCEAPCGATAMIRADAPQGVGLLPTATFTVFWPERPAPAIARLPDPVPKSVRFSA